MGLSFVIKKIPEVNFKDLLIGGIFKMVDGDGHVYMKTECGIVDLFSGAFFPDKMVESMPVREYKIKHSVELVEVLPQS